LIRIELFSEIPSGARDPYSHNDPEAQPYHILTYVAQALLPVLVGCFNESRGCAPSFS
jgi:hypothetical protein